MRRHHGDTVHRLETVGPRQNSHLRQTLFDASTARIIVARVSDASPPATE